MRPEAPVNDTNHLPPDDVLRSIGTALQAAYRLAGIDLPPDQTPEQLARSVFDRLRAVLEEDAPTYLRIHSEVTTELGPTATAEDIRALLQARLAEWRRKTRDQQGPAASA